VADAFTINAVHNYNSDRSGYDGTNDNERHDNDRPDDAVYRSHRRRPDRLARLTDEDERLQARR
jgi:hypothetical protein